MNYRHSQFFILHSQFHSGGRPPVPNAPTRPQMRLIEGKVMSESQIQTVSTEFAGRPVHSVSTEIAGRTLTIETGRYAEQADGAVTVRYGDTMLLATVVGAKESRE